MICETQHHLLSKTTSTLNKRHDIIQSPLPEAAIGSLIFTLLALVAFTLFMAMGLPYITCLISISTFGLIGTGLGMYYLIQNRINHATKS